MPDSNKRWIKRSFTLRKETLDCLIYLYKNSGESWDELFRDLILNDTENKKMKELKTTLFDILEEGFE